MNWEIIDAAEWMLPQLEELERRCFSLPWTREQLKGQLPDEHHVFLTALRGEQLLAYVGMMHVLDEGYISNVAVAPEERRQGIGDALIEELMRRAEGLALSFVTLEVRESNLPAAALYEKHGFSPVGRRKNYYELPREDAILMTNYLERGNDRDENTCF